MHRPIVQGLVIHAALVLHGQLGAEFAKFVRSFLFFRLEFVLLRIVEASLGLALPHVILIIAVRVDLWLIHARHWNKIFLDVFYSKL